MCALWVQAAVKAVQKRAEASFVLEPLSVSKLGGEEGASGAGAQRDEAEGAPARKSEKVW